MARQLKPLPAPLAYTGVGLACILLAFFGWWLARPSVEPAVPLIPENPRQAVILGQPRVITTALLVKNPEERQALPNRDACRLAYSADTDQWLVLQNLTLPTPPTTTPVVPPPPPTPSDTLFLYDSSGNLLRTVLGPTARDEQHISCTIFAPGGKQALTAGPSGALRLYNVDDSSLVWELLTKLPIQALAWSKDGKSIVYASGSNVVLVDAGTHAAMFTFTGHTGDVTALAFVGNSQLLTGSADCTLRLWDLAARTCLRTFEAHTQPITALAVNPAGTLAASGGGDARIILWNLPDGAIAWRYRGPQDFPHGASGAILGALFTRDGAHLLTTTRETADLWDVETHQPLVAYSSAGLGTGAPVACNNERAFRVNEFIFPLFPDAEASHDAVGPTEPSARGSQLRVIPVRMPGPDAPAFAMVRPLALLNNAGEAIVGSNGANNSHPGFLRVNLQTGECSRYVPFADTVFFGGLYDFSADGTLAALISRNEVLLADTSTGTLLHACNMDPSASAPLEAAALSPDGKFVAGAQTPYSHQGKPAIRIFNTSDGSLLRTLEGSTDRIRALAFSPDDRLLLAAGGSTETGPLSTPVGVSAVGMPVLLRCDVRVWDVSTGKILHTLQGHIRMVTAIEISSDGKRALTAAEFGDSPILWDLDSGKEILRLHPHLNRGRGANVTALALSPNGQYAATGGEDCDIRVYDLKSTSPAQPLPNPADPANPVPSPYPPELARFELHRGSITALRFLPDNKTLLSTSADGTLRLWQLP